jgi:hypothetical protein
LLINKLFKDKIFVFLGIALIAAILFICRIGENYRLAGGKGST